MGGSLKHDATASTKGTIYALYVALQKCFEMRSGQKVIIERYGDVTISASQQLEIKDYADALTDNHENFWKTLKNWMQNGFDETLYSALVLCTTQTIGTESLLRSWNTQDTDGRIRILETIHQKSEERFTAREKKDRVPETLQWQREVMDPERVDKLRRVVERFVIADLNPDASEIYSLLKDVHAKGILLAKQDDFLNALLGFVICPAVMGANSWEITNEHFAQKVADLTSQYCKETKRFPIRYSPGCATSIAAATAKRQELFVQKIHDIDYQTVIAKAIEDYVYASETTLKEFSEYEVPPSRHQLFANDVLDRFEPLYRKASRTITDVIKQSQDFYDDMMTQPTPVFPGFENPPLSFRNGVIHMHANDPQKNLKWRLESS